MAYEKSLRDQKLRTEIANAKRESNFYSLMIERSAKNKSTNNESNAHQNYKQRITNAQTSDEVDCELLDKIFS